MSIVHIVDPEARMGQGLSMEPSFMPDFRFRVTILSRLEGLLLIGALAGLHFDLSLKLDYGTIPNVIAAPFGIILFVANASILPLSSVKWILGLVALYVLSATYALGIMGGQPDVTAAVGLIVYSLAIGLGIYLSMRKLAATQLRRYAWYAIALMLGFALLEVVTPVQEFAIAFSRLYGADFDATRDVAVFGGYRPRLLTSEPSHAAISVTLALAVWLFSVPRWDWVLLAKLGAAILAALVLIRSPFVVLPIMFLGVRFLLWSRTVRRETTAQTSGRVLLLILGSAASAIVVSALLNAVFANRISSFDPLSDWSVTVRTYGAALAAWEAAKTHWFFGTGIANFEAARFELAYTYRQLGVPSYITETDLLEISINNAPSVLLIFFGFVGSIVYVFIWNGLLRSLAPGVPGSVIWSVMGIIGLSYSAIYSPGLVVTTFMLMAILAIAAKERTLDVRPALHQPQAQRMPWESRQSIGRPLGTSGTDSRYRRLGGRR